MKTFRQILFFFLLATQICFAQWIQTNLPAGGPVGDFAVSGTNLFAGRTLGGVFLSTDNGASWSAVNTGLTNTFVNALAVSGTNLFAGTGGPPGGVSAFLSTNNGASWSPTGLTNKFMHDLLITGTNVFAGASGGVFLSTDNGTSWTETNTGMTNTFVRVFAVSDTNIFAGTAGGVFLSTNNGASWSAVNTGLTNMEVHSLAVSPASGGSGTNLFAGTGGATGGVFLSTNNGASWSAVNTGLTTMQTYALEVSGTNIFAGTVGGIFLSTNYGASWSAVNAGLTDTYIIALAVSGTNLFAGTYGGGVFRRPLSDMVTGLENSANELPRVLSLHQNYPNPFNPVTKIRYHIVELNLVILKVYNVVGDEITTIVNEEKPFGTYEVTWYAENLPSGIYFYKLQSGSFIETKKMVLMK